MKLAVAIPCRCLVRVHPAISAAFGYAADTLFQVDPQQLPGFCDLCVLRYQGKFRLAIQGARYYITARGSIAFGDAEVLGRAVPLAAFGEMDAP